MATVVSELSTFETIRRQVQLLTGNRVDPSRAGVLINLTLQSLWGDHSWSQKKADATLTLVAPKTIGAVTLNADPRLVDGTGTSFATGDVGSYLRVGSGVPFYRVTSVTGQQLRLETPYAEDSFVSQPYTLFRHIYALPLDFQTFLSGSYWDRLHHTTQQRLDGLDAWRLNVGDTPVAYALRGVDSSRHPLVEIWPVPNSATIIRYTYLRTIGPYGPLDGEQVVPLRGDLVAFMTAGEALLTLAAEGANAWNAQVLIALGERHLARAMQLLEDALWADRENFGVPDSVPDDRGGAAYGADYLARHDESPVA